MLASGLEKGTMFRLTFFCLGTLSVLELTMSFFASVYKKLGC